MDAEGPISDLGGCRQTDCHWASRGCGNCVAYGSRMRMATLSNGVLIEGVPLPFQG